MRSANGVLQTFAGRYEAHWLAGMRAKLGLAGRAEGDVTLAGDLLEVLQAQGVDFTSAMRSMSSAVGRRPRHRAGPCSPTLRAFDAWAARWAARRTDDARDARVVAASMDRVNPIYIPRNHLVEAALTAATDGDLAPFDELVDVVTQPFVEQPGRDAYRLPAPPDSARYVTFCGT